VSGADVSAYNNNSMIEDMGDDLEPFDFGKLF
jgi:hypothetical protein